MAKLKNKVVIVTGGSKGIGAGIAKALAAEGASVVVSYVSSKVGAERVVSDIAAAGGEAIASKADISRRTDAEALVRAAIDHFGRIDILINNGGVYQYATIEESTEALYRRQFDINVLGTFLVTQSALSHLRAGASIVNISSAATKMTPVNSALYSATKGAIDAMTGVLSRELGPLASE